MRPGLYLCLILCAGRLGTTYADSPRDGGPAVSTVGDFAVKVAASLGYDASTPETAAAALQRRGIALGSDLHAALTEGEAAGVLDGLGVPVVPPKDPAAPVTVSKATALAGFTSLSANATVGTSNLDLGPIVACLHSSDRATCISCCQGIIDHDRIGGIICSLICKLNQPPPPSVSDPSR